MVESLVGLIVLLALTGLFVFLLFRVLRPRRTALKWVGAAVSGLLALLLGAVTVVAAIGFTRLYLPSSPKVADFTVAGTPEQIARGEHLATVLCIDCHSPDRSLPLSGGQDFGEGAPMPMGAIPAYNLTPAGPIAAWSDAELFRAIRYNIAPNGHRLAVMASTGIGYLSDEDIHALIAFLRNQPAVGSEDRVEKLTFVTTLLSGAGMLPIQPRFEVVTMPVAAASVEYGKYLVDFLSCGDCHGAKLTGGTNSFTPIGPSLIASVPSWTEEEFTRAIRTGERPSGPKLVNDLMPWETYKNLDDMELSAVYAYLKSMGE